MSETRILPAVASLLFAISAVAQTEPPAVHVSSPSDTAYDCHCDPADHFLALDVSGLYDSNTLRNDLVLGLWKGSQLDREVRQRSEGRAGMADRAGYAIDARLSYAWGGKLFRNENMRPRFSLAYHNVLGLRYTDDLYRLTFFGNGGNEGTTAHLGGSRYEQVTYQTFGIGFEDRTTRSFLQIQLVNGQRFASADVRHADLFTAMDGRYLHMGLEGDHARSDTAATPAFSNGLGLAISFEVRAPIRIRKMPGVFTFGMEDLGAIAWNDQSLALRRDTTLLYEGIRVDDVLDLDGVLLGADDLQDTLGLSYSTQALLRPLPTLVYLRFKVNGPYNMIYEGQVDVRNMPGYLPHAVIGAGHFFDGRNTVKAEVGFGGFGGWRAGLSVQRRIATGLLVTLRTTNAIGLASDHARGKSAVFGVEYEW